MEGTKNTNKNRLKYSVFGFGIKVMAELVMNRYMKFVMILTTMGINTRPAIAERIVVSMGQSSASFALLSLMCKISKFMRLSMRCIMCDSVSGVCVDLVPVKSSSGMGLLASFFHA